MATYVTRLTPAGTGAIATLGLVGPDAWSIVEQLRAHAQRPALPPGSDVVKLMRLGRSDTWDDVVVALDAEGAGRKAWLHCHGGVQVVDWLLHLCAEAGAEILPWDTWLLRAGEARLRVLAMQALAQAPTLRVASILLDQYHGALETSLRRVHDLVAGDSPDLPQANRKLDELRLWMNLGLHLTQPWRVVLAGPPNVGKSSLMNALLGYARAITSPAPGTTRDVVATLTAIDGWPVELIDTAGQRSDATGLEAEGIALALAATAQADLCLWVQDAQEPSTQAGPLSCPVLTVANKIDLVAERSLRESLPGLPVSAQTGQGVPALLQAIARALVPSLPPSGTAIPFGSEVVDLVEKLRNALQRMDRKQALQLLEPWLGRG